MAPRTHQRTRPDPWGKCFPSRSQGLTFTRELQPNGLHPIPVHQPAGPGVPEAGAARSVGRCQEEGTGGPVPQRRPGMATPGAARGGGGLRLRQAGPGEGDPLWHLRPDDRHRLGQRGSRSRHRQVRRGDVAALVAEHGPPGLSTGEAAVDHGRWGGSNGSRCRLWKVQLQEFADETGLRISVCHFPPGTSKWNKIEHRMFCYITENWRGRPLVSREVVVNLIGHTTTQTGLAIRSELDEGNYPTGRKVSDEQMEGLSIKRDKFHGEGNYSILPRQ